VTDRKLRIGVVGCGDVAYRRYFPPLQTLADRVEIAGCCSGSVASAERAAAHVRTWSPDAAAYTDLGRMLAEARLDAAFNLTPAPLHGPISGACLEAGVHVYSEKPLAGSIAEADRLIETAARNGLTLLCAPAVAVTRRFRWLSEIVESDRFGRLTLAVGSYAGLGPAGWREYTGDPAVFYGPAVGPVHDLGVYRLHALTTLLGPVRRVGAMGTIAIPERTILGGPRTGQKLTVTSPDHVLMHLEFTNGALGQLLSSFAVPATQTPRLEVHLTGGSISITGDQFEATNPVDLFLRAGGSADGTVLPDAPEGSIAAPLVEGWNRGLMPPPPPDAFPVVSLGVDHFLACLAGEEQPILTAEHARHVLEIVLLAYESLADGRARNLQTTF